MTTVRWFSQSIFKLRKYKIFEIVKTEKRNMPVNTVEQMCDSLTLKVTKNKKNSIDKETLLKILS